MLMWARERCSGFKCTEVLVLLQKGVKIILEFIELKMYHKISKETTERTEVVGINPKSVEAKRGI